ncbi:MAG TPA: exodeoxyribonuclease VII large subunit [Candidatus Scatavimonas merdigallinarum]|uniref:Exodeoxyribonuclease 7 large subunit n=1 Tax=Candidatus Scatavimonas merdigallinarum TaxID=2840914 RepID=A0A9D0ZHB8_9FIRM|nr:exodeoxyribonuclease VII large subunit [Candidatus Scatavimonas merdigallinarum]
MEASILSVSQLNFYIRSLLDGDSNLAALFVSGEISNLSDQYRSGHIYFTLKDEKAAVKCVVFANSASRLKFIPQNGMKVIVRAKASLYEAGGQYQLYIEDMQPDGAGALAVAFAQCKERLEKEGLFNAAHKKPLPKLPYKIGVITSPTGAVIKDIQNILNRRFPLAEILLCPVLVQGNLAAGQICKALRYLDQMHLCDVIIIARGGGSTEDLWPFNDELLAREIYRAQTPVVSAVGHETDFTICDFVADLRAPTPSAAAELSVPDAAQLQTALLDQFIAMRRMAEHKVWEARNRLYALAAKDVMQKPSVHIQTRFLALDQITTELQRSFERFFSCKEQQLANLSVKLDMLSPLRILSCGYALVKKEEKPVKSVKTLSKGDVLTLCFCDGQAECVVKE